MQKYIAQANFAPNLTEQYYKSSKYAVLDDSSGDFGLFEARAVGKGISICRNTYFCTRAPNLSGEHPEGYWTELAISFSSAKEDVLRKLLSLKASR